VGIDCPGSVYAGYGLGDAAGGSRHLRMRGRRGCQKTVWQRVFVGARDAVTDRGVARPDSPSGPDDRRALGANLGPLDLRADDGFHGGVQQPVFVLKAKGPLIPGG
jgi:hypothetical protein